MLLQADVVLLAYPLGVHMDRATQRNDLLRYENAYLGDHGPAMTQSMHVVGWLQLAGFDASAHEKAHETVT